MEDKPTRTLKKKKPESVINTSKDARSLFSLLFFKVYYEYIFLYKGYASGSFGPTTSSRMDSYVAKFQENGGSLIMLAKGNRSKEVTNACKKFGGFYLGILLFFFEIGNM